MTKLKNGLISMSELVKDDRSLFAFLGGEY